MATTNLPTLMDVLARQDGKGNYTEIAEVLNETNEMLDDIVWVECNTKFSHKTTVRTGLPEPTWRKLNYGVKPTKSTTRTISDTCGMLVARSTVDKKLVELNGNKESWRASEDRPHIEGMGQAAQRAFIYGDSSVDPEQIMGLAPRYNTLDLKKADTARNVIDAGGTGNELTSIWLIAWSQNTIHGIYPEGSKAGLTVEDLGEDTAFDGDGGEFRCLKTEYEWDIGLTVRDWEAAVRIANIDITKCKAEPGKGDTNLIDLLVDASELIKAPAGSRVAFYCNRTIRTALRKQIANSKNVHLSLDEVGGKKVMTFDGIPIRRVDALTPTEKQVTK